MYKIVPASPKLVALKVRAGYYVLERDVPIALAFTKALAQQLLEALECSRLNAP